MNEAEYLMKNYGDRGGCFPSRPLAEADNTLPGARFSKVPIINGPGKLSPFTLKMEVSIVLHLA